MTDVLSHAAFAANVGGTYALMLEGRRVELVLRAARALGAPIGPSGRAPFALDFEAIAPGRLEQRTYDVAMPDGSVEAIFLVPVGVTADGRAKLEAVFT